VQLAEGLAVERDLHGSSAVMPWIVRAAGEQHPIALEASRHVAMALACITPDLNSSSTPGPLRA
jgi:hypothetical protein